MRSGKLELSRQSTDVGRIAAATLDLVSPIATDKRIALTADVDPAVGRALLDTRRFQQILWNLLSNAVKFTPEGGRVSLGIRRSAGHLVVEVADTGQGITPDFLPHLFDRFRQANMRDSRSHSGLGIGLALCRDLVELHGGTIRARSEGAGRGSTFEIEVPSDAQAAAERRRDAGAHAPTEERWRQLHGLRVLLVEDHADTREAMVRTLRAAGAELCAVASGPEALAAVEATVGRAQAPEVMVCDIGLPGMDGYQLITRVVELCRARGQEPLAACAVSAHALHEDRRRALGAGFDLFVPKPVSAERLIDAVAEMGIVAGRLAPLLSD